MQLDVLYQLWIILLAFSCRVVQSGDIKTLDTSVHKTKSIQQENEHDATRLKRELQDDDSDQESLQQYVGSLDGEVTSLDKRGWKDLNAWGKRKGKWVRLSPWGKRRWARYQSWGKRSSDPLLDLLHSDNKVDLDDIKRALDMEESGNDVDKRKWTNMAVWGKRAAEMNLPIDEVNLPIENNDETPEKRKWTSVSYWGKRSDEPEKRKWKSISYWGKRADDSDTFEENKRKWSSMGAAWGKRGVGKWKSFSSWGKRSPWNNVSSWGKRGGNKWNSFTSWGKRDVPVSVTDE